MIHTDTIAAIATAMGNSGIGIVRISGQEAVATGSLRKKENRRRWRDLPAIRSITDIFMTGTRWWTRSW